MTWLLEALHTHTHTVKQLEITSLQLPRLDARLASQLMEPINVKGELGAWTAISGIR